MRVLWRTLVVLALVSSCPIASATSLFYELTGSQGRYEYSYSLANDTLGVPIAELTVFFPFGSFTSLAATSAPQDWDALVVEPTEIFGNPVDGLFDALALSLPLDPGQSLAGFRVAFDWLGTGLPGSQRFEIIDPGTFEVLDSGVTQIAAGVPEPGSLLLLLFSLAGVAALRSSKVNALRKTP